MEGRINPMGAAKIHPCLWRSLVLILLLLGIVHCGKAPKAGLKQIAAIDTAGWAHDVIIQPDKAYVADRQGGFLIFQRSRGWANPKVLVPVTDVISLFPHGSDLLLAARFEGLVLVSSSGKVTGRLSNGDIANAVAIRGNMAYAAYGLHGLVVARIDPAGLTLMAELPTSGWSHDVKLYGDLALVADWNYGLRVVDIHDPKKPSEIGAHSTPATSIFLAFGDPARRIVAVAEGHAGVALVSLDASGYPSLVARNTLGLNSPDAPHPENGGWAHGVAWVKNYLFVANWKKGLTILDTSEIRNPRIIIEEPTAGTALGVEAELQPDGSIMVFLAEGEAGLRVFALSAR